jgi:hypothetical protein
MRKLLKHARSSFGFSARITLDPGCSAVWTKCSKTIRPSVRNELRSLATNAGSVTGAHAKASTMRTHRLVPKLKLP